MAIPSFLQSLTKRNLPNGGGSYSVGSGTANSTAMFPGAISQAPEMSQFPQVTPTLQQDIERQNPVSMPIPPVETPQMPVQPQNIPSELTPEEMNKLQSLADEVVTGSYTPLGASYLDGNTSGVSDSVALRREMMRDRAQGTGLYSVPKGTFATPEQILGIRKMADQHYSGLIETASQDEKTKSTMEKNKPTSLASMSGTPWLEGLRVNGLVQGGTAGERAENLAYLSTLPEERQRALVKSGLYNSMSTGERQKFDSYDEVVAGTQQIASMLPADIETNPYKYVADKYSVFLGGKGTKPYQDFEAVLGRITAPIINNIYGAAVTGSELARAQTFIPDLAVDSTQRVGEKLKNLAAFAEFANDSALAKKAGMPKPSLDDYIQKYTGIVDGTYDDADKEAKAAGYSQEEIDAFKKKQGFSSVGNTSASVEIPKTSRLSFVNNNPGNLRFAGQEGASQGEGGFAKFSSPEAGVAALTRQIKLDAGRGHTLSSFIAKFAPPTENDTNQYITQATKSLGVSNNTPIKDIPLDKLTKFMALKESSTKIS